MDIFTLFRDVYGCFLKWWYPQIIHFNRVFHYKPSILGYHCFRKPPYIHSCKIFPCRLLRFLFWRSRGEEVGNIFNWSQLRLKDFWLLTHLSSNFNAKKHMQLVIQRWLADISNEFCWGFATWPGPSSIFRFCFFLWLGLSSVTNFTAL